MTTKEEFSNYRLKVEFKWGEKHHQDKPRNSGILVHCVGPDKIWTKSIECEIQEGDCGDFWLLGGTTLTIDGKIEKNRRKKKKDAEKPPGEWNTIEVVCDGRKITNIVNGVVVNEGIDASEIKGRILLQSEGAEVWYLQGRTSAAQTMSNPALAAAELTRRYTARSWRSIACRSRSIAGEIVGLLSPNGASKTTILGMLAGVVPPTAGMAQILGRSISGDNDPIEAARSALSAGPGGFYDELSAVDNLRFFGGLYSLGGTHLDQAIDRVLQLVGLNDRSHERVKHYSGGMKRRLNLAASLLHDPDCLLLDEPTVGVDPQSRNSLFETLERLRHDGKAIIYSSPLHGRG